MKKVIASILCAVMILMSFSIVSFAADEPVAKIGDTTYSSLEAAITAVNADTSSVALTIELLKDVTLETAKYAITRNNVTLDGKGFTLKVTGAAKADEILTFSGANNSIKNIKFDFNLGYILHTGGGTAVIENVSLTVPDDSSSLGSFADGAAYSGTRGRITVTGAVNMTVKNCDIRSGKSAPMTFTVGTNVATITLEDNKFINPKDYGRCIDVNGNNLKVTVKSGYYEVMSTAVFRVWAGELVVESGTFNMNGNGDALLAAQGYDAATGGKITVNNGVFITKDKTKTACIYSGPGTIDVKAGVFINVGAGTPKAIKDGDTVVLDFEAGQKVAFLGNGIAPSMTDGAAVVLKENTNGLCFTSTISKQVMDDAKSILSALEALATEEKPASLTFGTLICTTKSLEGPGGTSVAFTHQGLASAIDTVWGDVVATETGMENRSNGSVSYKAAVSNIPSEKLSEKYSAVSYIKFSAGTTEFYLYSEYSEASNSRSLADVVAAALSDGSASYTDAQKSIMNSIH